MPRSMNSKRYPYQFYQVLAEALRPDYARKGFAVPCEDARAAQHLRFRFYNFVRALKRSETEEDISLAKKSDGLEFLIRDSTLLIVQRDSNAEALQLERAIALNAGLRQVPGRAQPPAQAESYDSFDDMLDALLPDEEGEKSS